MIPVAFGSEFIRCFKCFGGEQRELGQRKYKGARASGSCMRRIFGNGNSSAVLQNLNAKHLVAYYTTSRNRSAWLM